MMINLVRMMTHDALDMERGILGTGSSNGWHSGFAHPIAK
jgi:hypothetical protein